MTSPELTIAVLTRNRPEYLRLLIESLGAAARGALIVVRDHSDDDRTQKLVDEFAAQGNLGATYRHVHARPRGLQANVIGAVGECETPYLAMFNDDDLVTPAFSQLLSIVKSHGVAWATGEVDCIDENGLPLPRMAFERFRSHGRQRFDDRHQRVRFHVLERRMRPFMGTVFRTDVLSGLRLPPEAPTQPDLWIGRFLADSTEDGWCIPDVAFLYRVHSASMTRESRDLDGYRFSMRTFLADPLFAGHEEEIRESLRVFEWSTFLARFVGGDHTGSTIDAIVSSRPPRLHPVAVRALLRPPTSWAVTAYLRHRNPRLRAGSSA